MAPFTSTWLLRQLLVPVDSFDKLQAASPSLRRFVSFDRLKFPLSSVTASPTQILQRSGARPTTISRMQLMSCLLGTACQFFSPWFWW